MAVQKQHPVRPLAASHKGRKEASHPRDAFMSGIAVRQEKGGTKSFSSPAALSPVKSVRFFACFHGSIFLHADGMSRRYFAADGTHWHAQT